jgi:hypothetical protein
MGRAMTAAASTSAERGIGPFGWFAAAIGVGAAWALIMGLEYYNTPTFTTAALPTIAGVAVAVAIFFVIGWRAPPNE